MLVVKTATELARIELESTHPLRLGVALNFSVFYYEVQGMPEHACRLAQQAIDDAVANIDTLTEQSFVESTRVMQLLQNNLTLWTSDGADGR